MGQKYKTSVYGEQHPKDRISHRHSTDIDQITDIDSLSFTRDDEDDSENISGMKPLAKQAAINTTPIKHAGQSSMPQKLGRNPLQKDVNANLIATSVPKFTTNNSSLVLKVGGPTKPKQLVERNVCNPLAPKNATTKTTTLCKHSLVVVKRVIPPAATSTGKEPHIDEHEEEEDETGIADPFSAQITIKAPQLKPTALTHCTVMGKALGQDEGEFTPVLCPRIEEDKPLEEKPQEPLVYEEDPTSTVAEEDGNLSVEDTGVVFTLNEAISEAGVQIAAPLEGQQQTKDVTGENEIDLLPTKVTQPNFELCVSGCANSQLNLVSEYENPRNNDTAHVPEAIALHKAVCKSTLFAYLKYNILQFVFTVVSDGLPRELVTMADSTLDQVSKTFDGQAPALALHLFNKSELNVHDVSLLLAHVVVAGSLQNERAKVNIQQLLIGTTCICADTGHPRQDKIQDVAEIRSNNVTIRNGSGQWFVYCACDSLNDYGMAVLQVPVEFIYEIQRIVLTVDSGTNHDEAESNLSSNFARQDSAWSQCCITATDGHICKDYLQLEHLVIERFEWTDKRTALIGTPGRSGGGYVNNAFKLAGSSACLTRQTKSHQLMFNMLLQLGGPGTIRKESDHQKLCTNGLSPLHELKKYPAIVTVRQLPWKTFTRPNELLPVWHTQRKSSQLQRFTKKRVAQEKDQQLISTKIVYRVTFCLHPRFEVGGLLDGQLTNDRNYHEVAVLLDPEDADVDVHVSNEHDHSNGQRFDFGGRLYGSGLQEFRELVALQVFQRLSGLDLANVPTRVGDRGEREGIGRLSAEATILHQQDDQSKKALTGRELSLLIRLNTAQLINTSIRVFGLDGCYDSALYLDASKTKSLETVERDSKNLQGQMRLKPNNKFNNLVNRGPTGRVSLAGILQVEFNGLGKVSTTSSYRMQDVAVQHVGVEGNTLQMGSLRIRGGVDQLMPKV
ncbi:conserved hypothetical protein [Culex quinquefasciatus]|uniref:Uncharacterized protein n=1 Tax=Culex quinquefasciatus TaxID=7176 RepID=B0X4K0_CULQU|nr:conserved hypothetical protein [Culex quinquefasciatus]|eukprot:XP_001864572.1 conserved hypothetical protein [Culex quinquefasciatus]